MKNKKAMLDDLFDFLFTVVVAFFAFMLISSIIDSGINARREQTLQNIDNFQIKQSANIFLQEKIIYEGKEYAVIDFIRQCLDGNKIEAVKFRQLMDQKIQSFYPESYLCGYLIRSGAKGEVNMGCSINIISSKLDCPYNTFTFAFPGAEGYSAEFVIGRSG